ncbi:MAG: lysylphosphatidylglycerol synthase transmembrane domain-containing protein [bacterium]|nr:lysylphosphatidylglycerol synthase transmembrane domain-containing protein [bacterium]
MKKKLIITVFILLGLGLFADVLWKTDWTEVTATLRQLTLLNMMVFLLVCSISQTLMAWRWRIILKSHGYLVSFWKIWLYRMTGYGISYITPTQVGGEPARVYFLNENHDIPLRESSSSVLLDKLLEMSAFVVFVLSGVLAVSFTNLLPNHTLYFIFALLAVFGFLLGYAFKKLLDGSGFITSLFQKLRLGRVRGLQNFEQKILKTEMMIADFLSHTDHKRTTVPLICLISLLAWAFTIVEYALVISFFGLQMSFLQIFLVGTVPLFTYLLPLPGGLGALEKAHVSLFTVLGQSAGAAVAVIVMIRFKEIFLSTIGFAYALTHGLTLMGRKKEEVRAERRLKKAQKRLRREQRSLAEQQRGKPDKLPVEL